ncbi:allophanate hydrolase subunit 1 [Mycobacterium sp. ITM-2016-00318]|uniref:5-oxoprolinase subunit B family protein n=1 Tax=Mycobacterium sp. ITM-2016-00318 TaxID=2099693 RepID=UPI000CF9280C|nr:allophanate hydrolase subunit 1 [Mycobacterium sp. ITM-2016-00318]WNG93164.1 allophanate hydrolase subunit 1 [Mycobacterium sp. ITM-2016-00318]
MTVIADAMVIGTITDYGDQALLLQFDSTAEVLAWNAVLRDAELLGVTDIVPASRTVLVKLDGPRYASAARQHLSKLRLPQEALAEATTAPRGGRADVVIDVVYDGEDLDEVAKLTGMTAREVVNAHTRAPWRVGFTGFAPGFGYLIGGDERLNVPRRSEPRTKVPVGSVGLAGEFSGVYPRESPGGWQLIGHTSAQLWDVDREPPALLTPGKWVQFREVSS